jgi:hypothetical protein
MSNTYFIICIKCFHEKVIVYGNTQLQSCFDFKGHKVCCNKK